MFSMAKAGRTETTNRKKAKAAEQIDLLYDEDKRDIRVIVYSFNEYRPDLE